MPLSRIPIQHSHTSIAHLPLTNQACIYPRKHLKQNPPHIHSQDGNAEGSGGDVRRGLGLAAVWVARNRFAVLDKSNVILVKDLKNEITKKITPPHAATDMIFNAGTGQLLLRSEDTMSLFDLQQKKVMAEATIIGVKYVVWSPDQQFVAMLSKHAITICNRKLKQLCTFHETIRVKSGAWDENGVFIYTTLNHIKFALLSGDNGEGFTAPSRGVPYTQVWQSNCRLAGEHCAAGAFDVAAQILNTQIGVVNFEPLRPLFLGTASATQTAVQGFATLPCMINAVHGNWQEAGPKNGIPITSVSLDSLLTRLQSAYQATTSGKFALSLSHFRQIILAIPLLVVEGKRELNDAQQLVSICKEYVTGISMELMRKDLPKSNLQEQLRVCELAAYFTHCNLQPMHLILTVCVMWSVMGDTW
ncbi:hypothetical protein SARC_12182 [Sphaeroforma arctica JP610]|uniref:Coatomer alpha subunit C-terminal domain-containing protein n=1 Tax=Sphaeroforma arctica JP610 TaxID=667725 RepID=A0A0L0FEW2_9EUKA|nr:hypothetical protein SARC_12182 [Sphaeroforma arctica JP610]KNC75290.1 hypothetical protein SARC_12182 [Sphaeroforma arctica JP610]|eukprot:XP_014149192.1 hypothetical protein SARC_12182 [Sphaeroforma arctica JP610]